MQGDLTTLAAFAGFAGAALVLLGAGFVLLSFALKAKARHSRRLARVGRRRLAGHLEIDETRLHALRREKDGGSFGAVSEALARFVPVLDSKRLKANIRRGGLKLSVGGFVVIACLVGAVLFGLAVIGLGLSPVLAVLPSFLGGMLVVDLFVNLKGEMMSERFMKQLPGALDAIIRGVRAGLPVLECIANVGQEFEDPVGGHFRTIAERVQLGESLDVALWRTAEVVDRPEMDFLAIGISIQMETGGSLGEALGNLAALLRAREAMKLKVKAISSEAKASAMIIGALPFLMLALLATISPDYVAPLFTDPRGQFLLMLALGSISIGAVVMWRMTKFEI